MNLKNVSKEMDKFVANVLKCFECPIDEQGVEALVALFKIKLDNRPAGTGIPVTVKVVFGSESICKIENGTQMDDSDSVKSYTFADQELADAFLEGVAEGVGWHEHYVAGPDEEKLLPEHSRY